MRQILTTRDLRFITILEILQATEWISLSSLSTQLNCAEKTVRNDLKVLTSQFDHVEIETSNTLGYRLLESDRYSIENISDLILSNSLIYQIILLLFYQPAIKMTEIEDTLFVSANSIRSAILPFNAYFENEGIEISSKPFELSGDEVKISNLLAGRLSGSYFKRVDNFSRYTDYLTFFIKELFYENPDLKKVYEANLSFLNLLLFIRIMREKNGYTLPLSPESLVFDYQFVENKDSRDRFFKTFGFSISNQLVNQLVDFALYKGATASYLQTTYLLPTTSEYQRINYLLQQMLEAVANKLQITPLTQEELNHLIVPHGAAHSYGQTDLTSHRFLLQVLSYELRQFFKKHQLPYSPLYENYFIIELALFLERGWPELVAALITIDRPMSVALAIFTYGDHQLLLDHYFINHFDSEITFHVVTELSQIDSFDGCITNLIDGLPLDIPTINIASYPNKKHLIKLETLYESFRQRLYVDYQG